MNAKLLKITMLEKDITQTQLAKYLNISKTTLSLKLSGKSEFTTKQIRGIRNYLKLSDEQFVDIFFAS